MFSRAIALLLSLTLLWSGAALAGQPLWAQAARAQLPGMSSPTSADGPVLSAPAPSAAVRDASALLESLALHDGSGPLHDEPPASTAADEFASSLHGEALPDVVALLELGLGRWSAGWRSPRPQALCEALPRPPHLEGLRRPPRLGLAAA